MPRVSPLLIVCVVIVSLSAAAPPAAFAQYAELSGHILDQTGAPIAGARIRVVSRGKGLDRTTTSSSDGAYLLSALQPDEYVARVEADGFQAASRDHVRLDAGARVQLDITLRVDGRVDEDLTVNGQVTPSAVSPSTIELAPIEVRSVAGAGENVFRVLQTLPGVSFTSEAGSKLTVRGGGPDQNLTLMDGVEIHNPYRLFGLTSAFNPEVIDRFELMTGGFSAKYGDRLSSVLLVENRDGTRDKALTGSASMSFVDANVVAEGRLPRGARGSWLVTARRTFYDLVAERIIKTDLPAFTDLQGNASWESRRGQRVTVFGVRSREHTDAELDGDDLGDARPRERLHLRASTHHDLAGLSLATPIGSRASSKTTVSWYRMRDVFDYDGDLQNEGRQSNSADPNATILSDIVFTRTSAIRDVALRHETTVHVSPTRLVELGVDSHWLRTGWSWRITGDRETNQPNGSSPMAGVALPARLDSMRSVWRGGGWLIDHWMPGHRVQIDTGVRLEWSDLTGEVLPSPRLAATADMGAGLRLRVAGGMFRQSPGYEKILQSSSFVDLSEADTAVLKSEESRHALVALERRLPGGLFARAEGYYKRFDRLLLGRLERPEETAARVARYDFPAELAWSVPRAPQVTSLPSNEGRGRAYGLDLYVARQSAAASDRLTGWASYTWGKAETTAYGRTFPSDYDHRHALTVVASYRLTRLVALAATVRVQSGFPFTPPLGLRVAEVEDRHDLDGDGNATELVPQRDAQGLLVWATDYGDVSNFRSITLPLYARVDLRATFSPGWMNRRWQLYAEVMNLLDRRNVSSVEPVLEHNPDAAYPRVSLSVQDGLPLLPSLGLRFRF
jgi:Carboxypeptidase regulatory-like domain/TonB-dependent Receptor Plug Domain